MTKTIGTKVDDEIYEVFRLVCEKDGVNVSDRLRDLVNEFVKEEAPYLVIDQNVCEELKRIAEEKGEDWKQMTCNIILDFCEREREKPELEVTDELYAELEAIAKKRGITVDQLAEMGFKWFFEKERIRVKPKLGESKNKE